MRQRFQSVAAALTAFALVGFFGTLWYFVHTVSGQRFDSEALRGQDLQLPRLILASDDVVRLGLLFGSVFVGALMLIELMRGERRVGLAAVIVFTGSFLTTQAIKVMVHRPRLFAVTVDDQRPNSFPSGHSTLALSVAVALIMVSPLRLRGLAAVMAATYAATIAAATVFARWHRPSDVIGAALVVMVWTFATTLLVGRTSDGRSPPRFPWLTLTMLTLIGGVFVFGFTSMTSDGLSKRLLLVDANQGRVATEVAGAFDVGTSAIAVASCVLVALVLVMFPRMVLRRHGPPRNAA